MAPRFDRPEPGPEPIKEVLARLFTSRGWGRRSARLHLERAWTEAVGAEYETHTRVLGLKRGILDVEVDSAILVQELTHYHKRRLVTVLRARLPGQTIKDVRFRVGNF
jgi:predicted nucleic acid-binding Zn ribbon protein